MRTFTQKQNQPQKQVSSSFARSNTAILGPNHHANLLLHLQRTIGNQAVQRMLQTHAEELEVGSISTAASRFAHDFSRIPVSPKTPVRPQAKLSVSTPNDSCEQEADAIADQVTWISDPQVSPLQYDPSPPKPLSALFARIVQTKSQSGAAVSNTLSKKISSSLGGGSQMDPNTQDFMQRSFGTDFRHVRIHTDGAAAQISRELGAYAFTVGRDIYFGSGYSPGTRAGNHLLAHELTHTIQQGRSNAVQKQTAPNQQAERGLVNVNEKWPEGAVLPYEGPGVVNEEEPLEAAEPLEQIQMQIQRSTNWAGATVYETRNKAEDTLRGGAPITWHMLNGTKLETEADADSSVNLPTISTSGSGKKWTAKVDTVPAQEGAADETVLAPGPWSIVAPKSEVGTKFGLAACTGPDDTTFSALGQPSDDALYKANRRHEDHHVADHKAAFEETLGKWDKKVEKAKSKGTKFKGQDAAKAEAALWRAMGGEPKKVARKYRTLGFTKGGQYHATAAGGPMINSNPQSNADCSTSSVDVTNPS